MTSFCFFDNFPASGSQALHVFCVSVSYVRLMIISYVRFKRSGQTILILFHVIPSLVYLTLFHEFHKLNFGHDFIKIEFI